MACLPTCLPVHLLVWSSDLAAATFLAVLSVLLVSGVIVVRGWRHISEGDVTVYDGLNSGMLVAQW